MKSQIDRKVFLQVTVATTLAGLVGCGGDDGGGAGDGDGDVGDGDGDMMGTGGSTPGTGGSTTTGGSTSTGGEGTGTGGDTATGGDAPTGGADGTGGGGGPECAGVMATDTNTFHQHVLTVTPADVMAGVEKTYTVSMAGQDPHDHEVTLTAADFQTLADDGMVSVDMDPDGTGHTHTYDIVCQA